MALKDTQIGARNSTTLREPQVEQVLVCRQIEGVLHVEEDLVGGPIDEPVHLDVAALVQSRAVQFIIRNLWGLKKCPLAGNVSTRGG